jgi:hypothetical protein
MEGRRRGLDNCRKKQRKREGKAQPSVAMHGSFYAIVEFAEQREVKEEEGRAEIILERNVRD